MGAKRRRPSEDLRRALAVAGHRRLIETKSQLIPGRMTTRGATMPWQEVCWSQEIQYCGKVLSLREPAL
ncbi:hypothetical protein PF003_g6360 [Phytophthora fragariae]|nr:hypothetical protein PF003_g6360 [Phytophthora fragariae]